MPCALGKFAQTLSSRLQSCGAWSKSDEGSTLIQVVVDNGGAIDSGFEMQLFAATLLMT
jgi:hypothetical protein